jgi:hypothetical protein
MRSNSDSRCVPYNNMKNDDAMSATTILSLHSNLLKPPNTDDIIDEEFVSFSNIIISIYLFLLL